MQFLELAKSYPKIINETENLCFSKDANNDPARINRIPKTRKIKYRKSCVPSTRNLPRKVTADIFLFLAKLSIRTFGAVCGLADVDVAMII